MLNKNNKINVRIDHFVFSFSSLRILYDIKIIPAPNTADTILITNNSWPNILKIPPKYKWQ